ncbi:ketopantoate reductase family protein [Paenibacillus humicus]|uniref:ketopantoate reductase family protein n=1 Tax=Paenibacillus humicus TaxID=412861 RepID=UPI003D2D9573
MKFEIVGSGALGLLFGSKLAASGQGVRFWTRTAEQAELLVQKGIVLQEGEGSSPAVLAVSAAHPLQDAARLARPDGHADWVMLVTKQRHIYSSLVKELQPLLGPKTHILCFQNGVGHLEYLSASFPGTPIYAAITTEGAKRPFPWQVIRSGQGTTTIGMAEQSGESADLCSKNAAEKLIDALNMAGFYALLSKHIDREIYRKLLINAVINPLTAIWRIPNGELLDSAERRALLKQLCDEAAAIYTARGIPFEGDAYELVAEVCRLTASNTSSMLKDVLQGTPTEIDYINGRLAEMAKQAGVSAPGHELLWRLVRGLHK